MNRQLKKSIKKIFGLFGIDIRRSQNNDLLKIRWLKNLGINTVIDVGANTGQFASTIHEYLPKAKIISFEPLLDCYKDLINNMKSVDDFRAYNYAVADVNVENFDMHRSSSSPSSSLLKMCNLHKKLFPYSDGESIEKVNIRRLDDIINDTDIVPEILLKIDVQGTEDKVINGANKVLSKTKVVLLETSFEMLYENQVLFDSIYKMLSSLGFSYKGNWNELRNPEGGELIQADSIFIRENFKSITL